MGRWAKLEQRDHNWNTRDVHCTCVGMPTTASMIGPGNEAVKGLAPYAYTVVLGRSRWKLCVSCTMIHKRRKRVLIDCAASLLQSSDAFSIRNTVLYKRSSSAPVSPQLRELVSAPFFCAFHPLPLSLIVLVLGPLVEY